MKNTKSLIKSKTRVKTLGEVFTPPELVNEMLDKLPSETWQPEKTFIDPACGNANFVIEVIKRKMLHGSSVLQAISTTYGIDIMEDNIAELKARVSEIGDLPDIIDRNFKCADTLKTNIKKLFPHV